MHSEGIQVQNEFVIIKMVNGILYGKYLVGFLDMNVVNSVMKLQVDTFGKNTPLILVDMSKVKGVTKEVREYFANPEVLRNVTAMAYITPSFLHKLLLTFFMAFNKPGAPMAYFTSESDAIKWLNKFR